MRSIGPGGPFMIQVLIEGAKQNKVKREVIDSILMNIPFICSKADLTYKASLKPSILELIQQGILENCDWCVKLKRIIDARNAFFEGLSSLSVNSNANNIARIEQLAEAAYKEGYHRAPNDSDITIAIYQAANKNDWTTVFSLLDTHKTNETIMTDSLYDSLYKLSKYPFNFMVIHKLNQFFDRNRFYTYDDYLYQHTSLKGYDRFYPSATFVSHALIKTDDNAKPTQAMIIALSIH